VALVTDGRFSGATTGPCIGHVEMEAFNGGIIGAIRDGDMIDIDIPARQLNLRLEENEIRRRLIDSRPPDRELTSLLSRFRGAYTGTNCYGKRL
jgi:dihydroxy-acid dehydratase